MRHTQDHKEVEKIILKRVRKYKFRRRIDFMVKTIIPISILALVVSALVHWNIFK